MKSTFFAGTVATLFAAAAVPSATGATIYYTNGTVTDPNLYKVASTDIMDAGKWGAVPTADNAYRIEGPNYQNRKFCGIGGTGTFPGTSLTVYNSSATLVFNETSDWTFNKLSLRGGVVAVKKGTSTIRGPVEILSQDFGPAKISGCINADTRLTFTGKFTGTQWAGLSVIQDTGFKSDLRSVTVFQGDMSGYAGAFSVGGSGDYTYGRAYFGDTSVAVATDAKPLTVYKTGTIAPCGAGSDGLGCFSVGKLTLNAGATLLTSVSDTTGGCVRVTKTLTMPTTGKVNVKIAAIPTGVTCRRTLLVAPLGTGLKPDQFDLVEASPITAYVKNARSELLVEKDEREERLVYVLHKAYTLETTDGWNQSALELAYSDHWKDVAKNTPLDPDGAYYLDDSNWAGKSLATSYISSSGTVRFQGYSLTAATRATIQIYASLDIDRLYLYGSTSIGYGSTHMSRTVSGRIFTLASTASDYVNIIGRDATRNFYIKSEISGASGLQFSTRKDWYGSYSSPVFHLSGTNTALSGKILVTNQNPSEHFSTLVVADGRSLGGAMTAFTYNGIELTGRSLLRVTAATEFAEPTRGWFINGQGRISVPNIADEVKIWSQLTMAGKLVKEGAGALALGGACRFTSAQGATPLEGTNVLEVAAGRIKAIAKTGYDGLAIKFAAGTGIELPRETEASDDVKAFGVYDVAWATPFDLSACGGVLNVGFRDWTDLPRGLEMAVCTVSSAAAAGLRGKINFVKEPGHVVNIVERDNGDGTVTFVAQVARAGFIIMVK